VHACVLIALLPFALPCRTEDLARIKAKAQTVQLGGGRGGRGGGGGGGGGGGAGGGAGAGGAEKGGRGDDDGKSGDEGGDTDREGMETDANEGMEGQASECIKRGAVWRSNAGCALLFLSLSLSLSLSLAPSCSLPLLPLHPFKTSPLLLLLLHLSLPFSGGRSKANTPERGEAAAAANEAGDGSDANKEGEGEDGGAAQHPGRVFTGCRPLLPLGSVGAQAGGGSRLLLANEMMFIFLRYHR
jgi:hypothetical protein